jgi:hypothetical protein
MTGRKDSLDKSAGTKQYGKYNKDTDSNDMVVDTRYASQQLPGSYSRRQEEQVT